MMHAARKITVEQRRPGSFVELVRCEQDGPVHLVRTYDRNARPCWFLLRSDERKLMKLEQTLYEDIVDLTRFGEIVDSGWGHEPEEGLLEKFRK